MSRGGFVHEGGEGHEGERAVVGQHPRGQDGTIFVTIEDETGDVQIILWPRVFARCRRELGSQVVLVRGEVSRWDGTTNVIVSDLKAVRSDVTMPGAVT